MKMTLSVGSTGKNKSYTKTEDFKRYSSVKKGISSVLTEVIAAETYQKLNLKPKQRIPKGELRDAVKTTRKEVRKNLNRNDYIKTASFSRKKLGIKGKYELAAQTFYRIVCRTPYDEDYKYTASITSKEYKPRQIFRSSGKRWRYVNHTFVRTHKADEDRVKDFWQMRFKTSKGYISFSMKDFEGIEFERISDGNWVQVENIIGTRAEWKDFSDLEIFNLHPRTDMLEYGRYTKASVIGSYEKHSGPNREHGLYGGYSVQAPRGFIGLSITEFNESFKTNKYEERKYLSTKIMNVNKEGKDDGYAYMHLIPKEERVYSDKERWVVGYSINLSRYLKHAITKSLEEADWIEEKDLLKAFLGNRNEVEINTEKTKTIKEKAVKIANAELRRGFDLIGHRNFKFYDTLKKKDKGNNNNESKIKIKIKSPKTQTSREIMVETPQNDDREKIMAEFTSGKRRFYGIATMPNDMGKDTDFYCRIENGNFYKTVADVNHINEEDLPRATFEKVDIHSLTEELFYSMFRGDDPIVEVQI